MVLICCSISGRDVKRLNAISGIGKKTAERIVVELADKIGDAEVLEALAGASDGNSSVMRDAVMALIALGYQQAAARKMVGQVLQGGAGDVNVEDVIKKALGG